ncbi:uncharacterized protein DDB_G0287625-like [Uranotaenia lowii]|uniref:uncharacterized protein DDB_G0287625-like n=1 Tax=Uranotaenia lowii TaxID=190385 RepID=UPI00247AFD84|nr:uncharacterized protein DDB_G0287625-like [Uranotaenia lowii]
MDVGLHHIYILCIAYFPALALLNETPPCRLRPSLKDKIILRSWTFIRSGVATRKPAPDDGDDGIRSRKRRPSYSQDDREYYSINDDDPMDECNAALVLMSLSTSPKSSVTGWENVLGTSSGSSSTSWSTGSTTPPLSEDGHSTPPNTNNNNNNNNNTTSNNNNNNSNSTTGTAVAVKIEPGTATAPANTTTNSSGGTTNEIVIRGARTTSLSNSDEGIGMDYNEDMPRKRRQTKQPLLTVSQFPFVASSPIATTTLHYIAIIVILQPDDESVAARACLD